MDEFRQDLRFGLRSLRGAPGTSIIAVLCLALGIGANTAIFSVARAVLLESLPYTRPQELLTINEHSPRVVMGSVSTPLYEDLVAQRKVFASVSAWNAASGNLGDVDEPERLFGVSATVNLFETLGARPLLGRTFAPTDAPAAPVIVVSEGLWRRRFAADPGLIGRSILLDNRRRTVIGIMPASFDFPVFVRRRDFWIPLDPRADGEPSRNRRSYQVVARMAPGVDSAGASVGLSLLARQLETAYPESNKGRDFEIHSMAGNVVGSVRPAIIALLGAVGLVLLIACANVANLTLVRAAARRRDVAIRTALGASRVRLIRQLLVESLLTSLVGGVLGVFIAWWGLGALAGLSSGVLPRSDAVKIQADVLLYALLLSVVTGMLVGAAPATRASKPDLRVDLADAAGKSSASVGRHRTLRTLIVAEIALSVVLLVGASLMIRTFVSLLNVDPGFNPHRVLTFAVSAPPANAGTDYERFFQPLLDRVRALPGVRAAGMTQMLPLQGGMTDRSFHVVGRPVDRDPTHKANAQYRLVSSDYFRAMGIQILSGRDFTPAEVQGGQPVVLVNDELTRRYFQNEDPLGKQIEISGGRPMTIVGVVKAIREAGVDHGLLPELYVPASEAEQGTIMSFVVSTTGDPMLVAGDARRIAKQLAPAQPLFRLSTMEGVMAGTLATRRLLLTLLGLFAGLALVLAAAGIYGVMSHAVAQRSREIGIRIALGARASDVMGMVMRDVAATTSAGILVGIVAALAAARLMSAMLFGVGSHDFLAYFAALTLIGSAALLAGAIPAIRAARVDPLVAMRSE